MRGYADEEVDVFLDEVADEFERLFQENIELQDRIQRLEEQMAGHAQIREALEKTLITAQLQADETKANARKESELILRDAELKARDIVSDSYKETQQVQQALIQLKHLEEDFRFKFRSLLEGHLKLLNEAPISVTAREPAALEGVVAPGSEAPAASGAAPLDSAAEVPSVIPAAGPAAAPSAPSAAEADAVAAASEAVAAAPAAEPSPPPSAFAEFDSAEAEAREQAERAQAEARLRVQRAQAERKVDQPPQREGLEAGFFFGRRLEEAEDVFLDPDAAKKKARDFEW
jgi:cell division initiation protein